MRQNTGKLFSKKSHFIPLIALLTLVTLFSGYYYYKNESEVIYKSATDELSAIAELKQAQITQWIAERNSEAKYFSDNKTYIANTEALIKNIKDDEARRSLIKGLGHIKETHGYENISIISVDHNLLFSLDDKLNGYCEATKTFVDSSINNSIIIFTDFYKCTLSGAYHLDIIAPMINEKDDTFAVILFRFNPDAYLFPLVKTWPIPSRTSETLLVRQENDSVVFINKLKYIDEKPNTIRLSLSEKLAPAVQAVQGFVGIFEGLDYRGEEVLTDIRPIAGTKWYMIAKVDKEEILSELYTRYKYILLFMFFVIVAISSIAALYYLYRQRKIYKSLWKSEEEFRITLYSIGDAVITTDNNGIIKTVNKIAEKLTGWNEVEAKGKKLDSVLKLINEETRENIVSPVQKVMDHGMIVGLANNTLLISKDGREIPIADSGAPIKDKDENILGVVLVFRDKSEELKRTQKLIENETRFRLLADSAPIGIIIAAKNGQTAFANRRFTDIFGYTIKDIPSIDDWWELAYPDKLVRSEAQSKWYEMLNGSEIKNENISIIEFPIACKDGSIKDIEFRLAASEEFNFIIFVDITERKRTESLITENERLLRESQKTANIGSYIFEIAEGTWTCSDVMDTLFGIDDKYAKTVEGWGAIIHPDWQQTMLNYLANEVVKNHGLFNKEYKIVRVNDKEERWVHGIGRLEFNKEGQPIRMIGTIQDITERKRAEEQLRDLKNNLIIEVEEKTKELKERIKELERFREATIDRELRIKELRDEIEKLKSK